MTLGHFYPNLPLMTNERNSKKLDLQKSVERLFFVFRIFQLEGRTDPEACRRVALKLNPYNPRKNQPWTYSYIRNIYTGKQPPSRYIIPAIDKLYERLIKPPKPTRPRYRKIIEATSKEQWKQWNTLTADELRQALDNQVKGKEYAQRKNNRLTRS